MFRFELNTSICGSANTWCAALCQDCIADKISNADTHSEGWPVAAHCFEFDGVVKMFAIDQWLSRRGVGGTAG
jgi:hypothetical protein